MGIAKNRVFDSGEIKNLAAQTETLLKKADEVLSSLKGESERLYTTVNSISIDLRNTGLLSLASSLKGTFSGENYAVYRSSLAKELKKQYQEIPNQDSSIAKSTKTAISTTKKMTKRIQSLEGLIPKGADGGSFGDFQKALKSYTSDWKKEDSQLGQQMEDTLASLKGGSQESNNYSKDPVNLNTGNFIYQKNDLAIEGMPVLEFRRHYNSIDRRSSLFGKGWSHSYGERLIIEEETVTFLAEDGAEQRFILRKDRWHGEGTTALLAREEKGWSYQTKDGSSILFDESGNSIRYTDSFGNRVLLQREDGSLQKIQREVDGAYLAIACDEESRPVAVSDHAGRSCTYVYDEDGRLAESRDSLGNLTGYHYDQEGNLSEVTSPQGTTAVKTAYDSQGRAVEQTFPDGSSMSFAYDDEKKQVRLTERNGSCTIHCRNQRYQNIKTIHEDGEEEYAYNSRGQVIQQKDPLGNVTRYAYDSRGNLTQIIDALGNKTSATYDAANHLTSLSVNGRTKIKSRYDRQGRLEETEDALGGKTTLHYGENEKNRPQKICFADGSSIQLSYNQAGKVAAVTDFWGNKTCYTYDSLGRCTKTTGPKGDTTSYEYDAKNRVTAVIDALGQRTSYTYTPAGKTSRVLTADGIRIQTDYNLLNRPESITDPNGNKTCYEYDEMWNIKKILYPDGSSEHYEYDHRERLTAKTDPLGNRTSYGYDAAGNRIWEQDGEGNLVKYAYDALGRVITILYPDGSVESKDYDSEGNLICHTDENGNSTRYEYNAGGQRTAWTDALGQRTSCTYTVLGNIESITDAAGRSIRYSYLPGGKLESISYPGGEKETYRYDESGNCIAKEDSKGGNLSYAYDFLGRLTAMEGSRGEKEDYQYDAAGNLVTVTDGLGNATRYEYDANGNLTGVLDALGNQTAYTYDARNRLLSVMRGDVLQASYERDAAGNILTERDALGAKNHYAYDRLGHLIWKKDRDGYETSYTYDSRGRLGGIRYGDGKEAVYRYDPCGNLIQMQDWNGITEIENDALGRVIQVRNPDGKVLSYGYGPSGERNSIAYPDGSRSIYEYDEALRLRKLTQGESTIKYQYDEAGRLVEKILPGDVLFRYAYTSHGELEMLQSRNQEGILDTYRYSYDQTGRIVGMERQTSAHSEENGAYTYAYDSLGRLTQVQKDGSPCRSYAYDQTGNRIWKEETGAKERVETNYAYSNTGQLLLERRNNQEITYRYDGRGNLTEILENGISKFSYRYGATNRMEKANRHQEAQALYQYDGLGNRIGRTQNGISEQYILDYAGEDKNLLEILKEGKIETFTWDHGIVLSKTDREEKGYFTDELGSPLNLFDGNGTLLESYAFDEFGTDLYGNTGALQPFGFTGYQTDRASGTSHAKAREYLPEIGRFASEDIILGVVETPMSQNRYTYCFNSPLMFVDRDGMWPKWKDINKKISGIIRKLKDNIYTELVGTDRILDRKQFSEGKYTVVEHEGGNFIVNTKNEVGKWESWTVNINSKGEVKVSLSGTGINPSTWKISITNCVTQEVGENGKYTVRGGVYANGEGTGDFVTASGSYENIPFDLPDGTQIEDYAAIRWSYTMDYQNHNWEQWRQTFDAAVGLGIIAVLVVDDGLGLGALDDGLIVIILAYLKKEAPYAYDYILKAFPKLTKFASISNSSCPLNT